MRILLFHPVRLPPRDYGGIERMVLWLAQALVQLGHQVSIAALPGSVLPPGCKLVEAKKDPYTVEELASLPPQGTDLVHFMTPIPSSVWENLPFPKIFTLHGNGREGERFPKNTIFLSADHARRHGGKVFIYNGIDPSEYLYAPETKKKDYLFLSKTHWRVKNLEGAMRFSQRAKVSLQIAGGHRPLSKRIQSFFLPGFRWNGPVAGMKKASLLAEARALLFPIVWPEPFGLVVVEALISGTPVIAFPSGSLPELIHPGLGLLPETEEKWVEALCSGKDLGDPEQCRNSALKRFHFHVMAQNYVHWYQRVLAGETLHSESPVGSDWSKF